MGNPFSFSLLSDSNWETKVEKGLDFFDGIQRYFEAKNYGSDLNGIVLVMMCWSPELVFKQRKRYSKKDKLLYLDIMLNYSEMANASEELEKAKIILRKINEQLFISLKSYNLKDFNITKFKSDFSAFMKKKGL